MKTVQLPSGKTVPALGQGTWQMGENPSKRQEEILALQTGFELGLTLIDTAEMYGNGAAEQLVAEAIGPRRKEAYIVSKVLPHHATRKGTIQACEQSLRNLNTDYMDLYLLHWRELVPLEETLEAFLQLKESGKIVDYGVSNFDVDDMVEIFGLKGGHELVTNQVLYNLKHRGIEWDLLPWCRKRKIPLMAYSPIERGQLLRHPLLKTIASRHAAKPSQVALAWVLNQNEMIAIPKAGNSEHVKENYAALAIKLTDQDIQELDKVFLPPSRKIPLEII